MAKIVSLAYVLTVAGVTTTALAAFGSRKVNARWSTPRTAMSSFCSSDFCAPLNEFSVAGQSEVPANASERLFKANIQAKDESGKDPRIIQLRDETHAPVIVALNNKETPTHNPTPEDPQGNNGRGIWEGSATYVSPCYVIASYHQVFGGMEKHEADELQNGPEEDRVSLTAVIFVEGQEKEVILTPSLWGSGLYKNGEFMSFSKEDVALLEDKACNGKKLGWLMPTLIRGGRPDLVVLETLGYPVDAMRVIEREQFKYPGRDLTLEIVRDKGVRIYEIDRELGLITHNGSIQPRGSGGALIMRNPRGFPMIVGINLGTLQARGSEVVALGDSRAANVSIYFPDIDRRILEKIYEDRDKHRMVNPALKLFNR